MTTRIGSRVAFATLGLLAAVGVVAGARGLTPASAASGGTITGQVVWCSPVPYAMGVPGATDGGTVPPSLSVTPIDPLAPTEIKPGAAPAIAPIRPMPPRLIPAGAVLVAVQGTSLSARTSEDGRFVIEGVPAGQYLTVAVGPVAKMNGAVASRPNVFLTEGQKTDVGQFSLSQPCNYYGPVPYAVPATSGVTPEGAQ
jgi:hypothetical protein